MADALRFHQEDTVVVVTRDVKAGEEVAVADTGERCIAREDIARGHKLLTVPLRKDDYVIKYGIRIGRMMSDAQRGDWISEHNLADVTGELGAEYRKTFRDGGRTIQVFPRADGRFGVRNYVMVIPASPDCNAAAEAISDATGCCWMVCDRPHLENGRVSGYTRDALAYTGCTPNVFAVLLLSAASEPETSDYIAETVRKTGKPVHVIPAEGAASDSARDEGVRLVNGLMADAAAQPREPRPIEGLTVTLHCSGSDWTTTVAANPSVGKMSDMLVKEGARIMMSEWEGYCGNEHIMAAKCATRALGLRLLDRVDYLRELVEKESGHPIEYMNPHPLNKKGGITTLVEKSHGTITKCGSSPIQGILGYCEQPAGRGVWLEDIDSLMPPTSGTYGSLSGAHVHFLITGIGKLYYEIPHMPGIRVTGNSETFSDPQFKLDFCADSAFSDGLQKTGERLYEYLLEVVEGKREPLTEPGKIKAFHMWYYTPDEFGEKTDRSKMITSYVDDYAQTMRRYTDYAK